jgi:hypothetical protein
MKLFLITLFFSAVVFGAEKKPKKRWISEQDEYRHMINYLDKFSNVKEAKPMVNKIKNSDEYIELHAKFGTIIFPDSKKKKK